MFSKFLTLGLPLAFSESFGDGAVVVVPSRPFAGTNNIDVGAGWRGQQIFFSLLLLSRGRNGGTSRCLGVATARATKTCCLAPFLIIFGVNEDSLIRHSESNLKRGGAFETLSCRERLCRWLF